MLKSNIWKKGGERGLPPKPTELPPSSHRRVCAQVAHFWHWSWNFAKNLYFAEISAIFHFFRFFWSFFEVFNDFWTFQSFSMFFSLLRVFQWFDNNFSTFEGFELFLFFFNFCRIFILLAVLNGKINKSSKKIVYVFFIDLHFCNESADITASLLKLYKCENFRNAPKIAQVNAFAKNPDVFLRGM